MAESSSTEYLELLEHIGITSHPGGTAGTNALIGQLGISPGERVLDLGCGTGHTACLIAKRHNAGVVAADLRPGMLTWAQKRALREGVTNAVRLVAGDAHRLPFKDGSFDAALVESVLIFCDVSTVIAELHRVLKPGGRLGFNELTSARPISGEMVDQLAAFFGFRPTILTAGQWCSALNDAGFIDISSDSKRIDLIDVSLFTPVRTDGWKRYLSALVKSFTDPKVRKARQKKNTFTGLRLLREIDSGLYRARKPG